MKNLKEKLNWVWDVARYPVIVAGIAGAFYLAVKTTNFLEDRGIISGPEISISEDDVSPIRFPRKFSWKGYDVAKGIDKNKEKYLELRDGFDTRLEDPTTLIWKGDSINFYPGKDMGRGIHEEDSNHYFKSLTKADLEGLYDSL